MNVLRLVVGLGCLVKGLALLVAPLLPRAAAARWRRSRPSHRQKAG